MFKAILLTQGDDKKTRAELLDLDDAKLPERDVTVAVEYSTLNYKDALAITGRGAVVRSWPLVPGIDLAGTVIDSKSAQWKTGDKVVVTGWGLGENHWGGLAQKARLDPAWLLKIPAPFNARSAMTIATAGFTAALCVVALQRHGCKPGDGEVLVTGAAGGVGRFAIQLAHRAGAHVTGVIGSPERGAGLKEIGADELITELRPEGEPFDLLLESVGGASLAAALTRVGAKGTIVSFGASSPDPTTFKVETFYNRGGPRLYGLRVFHELEFHGTGVRDLELLVSGLADGWLDPGIGATGSLWEPDELLRALLDRRVAGKAVLTA
jgi:acrylyl-CoA reductase (NADPH)